MTVFPPSMIFCVPTRVAFRATLLPVSYRANVSSEKAPDWGKRLAVSMYSPFGTRRDILAGASGRFWCVGEYKQTASMIEIELEGPS